MHQTGRRDQATQDARRLDDRFQRGLLWSVCLHMGLLVFVLFTPGLIPSLGETLWGTPDGGVSGIRVGVATGLGGIALPRPEVVNETAAGNDSEGFYQTEAPPVEPVASSDPPVEAEPIPEDPIPAEAAPPDPEPPTPEPTVEEEPEPDLPPTPPPPAAPVEERSTPAPPNAVPFGAGGQPDLPLGGPTASDGTGLAVGDGAFGERYGRYVEAIRTRISSNWLQSTIDAGIRSAPRVYVAFDIERSGEVRNIRIEESSGNSQVDRSARRAIVASNPLAPLPRDYRGARVSVRFWFELRR